MSTTMSAFAAKLSAMKVASVQSEPIVHFNRYMTSSDAVMALGAALINDGFILNETATLKATGVQFEMYKQQIKQGKAVVRCYVKDNHVYTMRMEEAIIDGYIAQAEAAAKEA